jgi:hypothetical protein
MRLPRALSIVLIAVMWGSAAYGVAVIYGIASRVGECLGGTEAYMTPRCIAVRAHAASPGRYEILVALSCIGASLIATAVDRSSRCTSSRWGRLGRALAPLLVATGFVLVARPLDRALQDGGNALIAAILVLLVWLGTRDFEHVWSDLGIDPASHGSNQAPALHRLRLRVLTVIALCIGLAAAAERLVSPPTMRHIQVESVLVAAALCAIAGLLVLLTAQYKVVRMQWAGDDVLGRQRSGLRWLAACGALALLAIGAAVVAPPASAVVTDLGRAALAPLLGAAPQGDHHSCRTNKRYCGKLPTGGIKRAKRHQGRATTRKPGPSLQARILGTLIWLLAIGLVLYGWIGRSASRRRQLVQFLRAIWATVRRTRRRAHRLLESILPESVLEVTSAIAGGRTGRGGTVSRRTQIVRYYLNAVAYAGRRGIIRSQSQTPEDFAETVVHRLPGSADTWITLTTIFIAARYDRQDPSDAEVNRMRTAWQHVRRAIRSLAN